MRCIVFVYTDVGIEHTNIKKRRDLVKFKSLLFLYVILLYFLVCTRY